MQSFDYQEIGQYLKDSRESLRVSLEQAGAHLHIRVKYLKALEDGNMAEMPGKAYIRGYIRNYAQYLRLNVDEVLQAYGLLIGPKSHELFIPEPTSQQNLPTASILWLCFAGLILLYGFWYVYYHDRSTLNHLVAKLPANFVHMLDPDSSAVMDKAWEGCLNGADSGCYVTVLSRQIPPYTIMYDLDQLYKSQDK